MTEQEKITKVVNSLRALAVELLNSGNVEDSALVLGALQAFLDAPEHMPRFYDLITTEG